jgi:polysaccharide export outer membrane protein
MDPAKPTMQRIVISVFVLLLAAWPAARCAMAQDNAPHEYLIQPEDVIEITVWPDDKMSLQTTVRPDGTISYPFLGQLKVEGMTVADLTMRIEESLLGYLNNPKVAVNVTNFRRMRAFVLGAVLKPGVYDIRKGDTIMDLIAEANGFTDKAKKSEVALIRPPKERPLQMQETASIPDAAGAPGGDAMKYISVINVAEVLGKGEFPVQDQYLLQDGDIIFVPTGKKVDWQKVYQAVTTAYFAFSIDKLIGD